MDTKKITKPMLPNINRYECIPEIGTIVYAQPDIDFYDEWEFKNISDEQWDWIDSRAVIINAGEGKLGYCLLNEDPDCDSRGLYSRIYLLVHGTPLAIYKTQLDAVYGAIEGSLEVDLNCIKNALYLLRTFPSEHN